MTRVYFMIKANGAEYRHFIDMPPRADKSGCTARECCDDAKRQVMRESGRNAFNPFCCPRKPKEWQKTFMETATKWNAEVGF